jgi:hypothetical protein
MLHQPLPREALLNAPRKLRILRFKSCFFFQGPSIPARGKRPLRRRSSSTMLLPAEFRGIIFPVNR